MANKGVWSTYTEIEGLGECIRKFKQVENAFGSKGQRLYGTLLHLAQGIQGTAKSLAPVGPTGNLQRGVVAKLFMRQIPDKPAAFAAMDFRLAPHAHLIEFGHAARDGSHVPPVPFFRPAIDANRNWIFVTLKKEMQSMIMQAARR